MSTRLAVAIVILCFASASRGENPIPGYTLTPLGVPEPRTVPVPVPTPIPPPTPSPTPEHVEIPSPDSLVRGPGYPIRVSTSSDVEDDYLVELSLHPEVVGELALDFGAPAEAQAFLNKLEMIKSNPSVRITLGFTVNGRGVIRRSTDGAFLQSVYSSSRACSAYCRLSDNGAFSFLDPWVTPRGTSISDSTGTCGVLTALYILVSRGIVSETWDGVVNNTFWDDGFVNSVWKAAGSNTQGTSISQEKTAVGARWNTVWYGSCDGNRAPSAGGLFGIGATSLEEWCTGLNGEIQYNSMSCALGLQGPTILPDNRLDNRRPRPPAAHAMYVVRANWDDRNSRCEISTADTGRAGNPTGTNVPRDPGGQVWMIEGAPGALTVRNTGGANQAVWNGLGFDAVNYYCCATYRRYWSDPPERKGTAFD